MWLPVYFIYLLFFNLCTQAVSRGATSVIHFVIKTSSFMGYEVLTLSGVKQKLLITSSEVSFVFGNYTKLSVLRRSIVKTNYQTKYHLGAY